MAAILRAGLLLAAVAASAAAAQATRFAVLGSCGSTVDDNGFNQMANNAMEAAKAERGIEFSFVFCAKEDDVRGLIVSGHTFFIALGFEAAESIAGVYSDPNVAEQGVRFALVDHATDGLENMPNVQSVLFAEDLGAFAIGALAGMQTTSKSVGGVFGVALNAVVKFRNGFVMGVQHTCPECTIHTQYVWSFGDPDSGAAVANYMIEQLNADVIFAAAGGTGVGALYAGADKGVYVMGVDTDQFLTVFGGLNETSGEPAQDGGRFILSSVLKRVDSAVERIITEQLDGSFAGGKTVSMDYSNGGISLAPCHAACDNISSETQTRIEQIESRIGSGALASGVDKSNGMLLLENFYSPDIGGNSWTPVSTFGESPTAMQSFASDYMPAIAGQTELFVFGGVTELEAVSATLWSFNAASMSWRKHTADNQLLGHGYDLANDNKGEFPAARAFGTLSALRDRAQMVLFGGLSGTTRFNDAWLLSMPEPFAFAFETWTKLAPSGTTPLGRDGHAAAATLAREDGSSSVYIFGGFGSDDTLRNDLWRLTVAADGTSSWTEVCGKCAPPVRRDATMTFHNGVIYLVGGETPNGLRYSDAWTFTIATNTWDRLSDMPLARSKHSAVVMRVKPPSRDVEPAVVVFGGLFDAGIPKASRVSLSYLLLETNEWISVSSANPSVDSCGSAQQTTLRAEAVQAFARSDHAAFPVATGSTNGTDKMFILGGRSDTDMTLSFQMFHPSENDVIEDKRYSTAIAVVANSLGFINVAIGVGLLIWIAVNRKHPVVRASQVPFLALIVVGGIISSATIFAVTVDDQADEEGLAYTGDYEPANIACMLQIWLYAAGFSLMFGPAFVKIRRVMKLFAAGSSLKRVHISNTSLALSVLTLLLLDLSIVMVWQITDPLRYYRRVTIVDEFGNPLQSTGRCDSEYSFTFLALMFSLHILVLIYGNYISYKARNLSSHFSEGKHLQFALITQFELLAIATPVLAMVNEEPISRTFVMAGVIFLNTASTLAFLFIPKIQSVCKDEVLSFTQTSSANLRELTTRGQANMATPAEAATAGSSSNMSLA